MSGHTPWSEIKHKRTEHMCFYPYCDDHDCEDKSDHCCGCGRGRRLPSLTWDDLARGALEAAERAEHTPENENSQDHE